MVYLDELKMLMDKTVITDWKNEVFNSYESGFNCILDIFFMAKKQHTLTFFCGNGGSAAIAQHMTADYMKNGGFRAISLYNPATMSCISNDLGYEYVFSKQLELYASEGDLLIAISSSGESENIHKAINKHKNIGGKVITLTGFSDDNRIRKTGDYNFYVPSREYGKVESIHNLILQQFVDSIVSRDGVALSVSEGE